MQKRSASRRGRAGWIVTQMHVLAADVRRTISRDNLVPAGARVLIALSGGPDSVALLHLLLEVAPVAGFQVAGAGHLNHGLRGADADADERFCAELATRLGLPFQGGRADVRALSRAFRTSLEDAGRRARYGFLRDAAIRLGADRVAVGHTRDDQAETVLLQLFRGAGPRGLAGIHPAFVLEGDDGGGPPVIVVRPVLEFPRARLRRYVADRGLAFREDETNLDRRMLRNRVRHDLIPYLERGFAPGIVRVLSREAAISRADGEFLEQAARRELDRILNVDADTLELDCSLLLAEPDALAFRVARLALARLAPGRFIGYDHAARLLEFAARGPSGGLLQMPGVVATWQRNSLCLERAEPRGAGPADRPETNYFRVSLSIPGEASIQPVECTLYADRSAWPRGRAGLAEALKIPRDMAMVDAARLPSVLFVRGRSPGDRFRPLGLPGRKKLHDFFVDRKVPRQVRDLVPIVVDEHDRIVWVAGHAIAEEFRVTEGTEAVVILKLKYWRNSA